MSSFSIRTVRLSDKCISNGKLLQLYQNFLNIQSNLLTYIGTSLFKVIDLLM